MEYFIYQTCENDRWDSIATKFYGDCYEITPIIEANLTVPLSEILETGIELVIPKKNNLKQESTTVWKKE